MSFTTVGHSPFAIHAGGRLALCGAAAPASVAAVLPRPGTGLMVAEAERPLLSFRSLSDQIAAAVGGIPRAARDRAIDLLEIAGVPDPHLRADDRPHRLSALDRQRAQLALALAQGPELLVCVDPAAGLAPDDAVALAGALHQSQGQLGHALLIGTTDLSFAQRLVNEILVLDDAGQIVQRMRRG